MISATVDMGTVSSRKLKLQRLYEILKCAFCWFDYYVQARSWGLRRGVRTDTSTS